MSGTTQTTAQTIQSYYQDILARTGSAAEVTAWVNQVNVNGFTLAQVQNDFATSPEALANVAPILQMYQADLGRAADAAGLKAWVALEESGTSLATIGADIAGSAESQTHNGFTTSSAPTATWVNSLYVSMLGRQAEAGAAAAWVATGDTSAQIVAAIAGSAEAIADDKAAVTTYLATGGGALATGGTFTLTTGVDAGPAFTAGPNATFIGTVGATPANTTLNAGDSLTGTGTGNTLQIVDTAGTDTNANDLAGVTLAGIQTVSLQNASTFAVGTVGTASLNLALSPSVSKVIALNTAAADTDSFTGLAAGAQVVASGAGTGAGTTVDFAYTAPTGAVSVGVDGGANGVTFTDMNGTETAATISSTGAANGTTKVGGADTFNLIAGDTLPFPLTAPATITSLTVNAATNLVAALNANDYTAAAALTVMGAASSVNLGSNANFKTIDASGLKAGGLTIGLGTNTTSFKGGANNNVVTTAGVPIAATVASSINAGTGTGNTLVVAASADVATPTLAALYAGFSTLSVGGTDSVDVSNFTNSTITAETITGGAVTLSNLSAAQAAAITVTGNTTPTLVVTGATNPGTTDTVGLTVNNSATAASAVTLTNPTAAGVEDVNLAVTNSFDTATVTSLTGIASLENLVISGAGSANVTSGALALNPNSVFDASGLTGKLTLDLSGATGPAAAIKGAVGADTIFLDGTAGNTVDLTANAKGGSTVYLGASGAQTITLGTHSAADTISLNGSDANAVLGTVTVNNFTIGATAGTSDKLAFIGGSTAFGGSGSVTTGVSGLTATASSGILTYGGTATPTLANLIAATETILGTTPDDVAAFQFNNNTYVVGTPALLGSASSDHVFALNSVTGVTALGTTAAAHTLLIG